MTIFTDFRNDIQSLISQLLNVAQESIFTLDHWQTLENLFQGHSGLAGGHCEFSNFIKMSKFNAQMEKLYLTRIYLEF